MKAMILAAVAAFALSASVAEADEPVLSFKRLSFAGGFNQVYQVDVQPKFEVGAYGAYNLTPHLSLSGSVVREMTDAALVQSRVGVRVRFGGGQ